MWKGRIGIRKGKGTWAKIGVSLFIAHFVVEIIAIAAAYIWWIQ